MRENWVECATRWERGMRRCTLGWVRVGMQTMGRVVIGLEKAFWSAGKRDKI